MKLIVGLILIMLLIPPGPLAPGMVSGKLVGSTRGSIGRIKTPPSITIRTTDGHYFSCPVSPSQAAKVAAKNKGVVYCMYARQIGR